jgi:hypothetical protein
VEVRKISAVLAATAAAFAVVGGVAGAAATTAGTWEAYPGQSAAYQTAVQQPINADGSSSFKSNGKAVIPVKFELSKGVGPFAFESIYSDSSDANDYSFLSFTPSSPMTFNQITTLKASYAFTLGDCHGGALRWSVRTSPTQSVFIYYGNPPPFGNGGTGGCTPSSPGGVDQSGSNLIGLSDLRYDTTQYSGGTFYDTYAHAQALVGNTPVIRASLVLDAGWAGDQRLTLSSATVNDNTFTPQAGSPLAKTCDLPTNAAIRVTKIAGATPGVVNEPVSIQPGDDNGIFRVVDCKLMYNLATSSLSGPGRYRVEAIVNGTPAANPAEFDLR